MWDQRPWIEEMPWGSLFWPKEKAKLRRAEVLHQGEVMTWSRGEQSQDVFHNWRSSKELQELACCRTILGVKWVKFAQWPSWQGGPRSWQQSKGVKVRTRPTDWTCWWNCRFVFVRPNCTWVAECGCQGIPNRPADQTCRDIIIVGAHVIEGGTEINSCRAQKLHLWFLTVTI